MNIKDEIKPKLDWSKIIEEQEQSGLSQSAYCRQHGIDPAKLAYHRGRIKIKQRQSNSSDAEFKPIKMVCQENTIDEIKLSLPNGFQCVFPSRTDTMQIKKLIEILLSC
jgi:hypothetical protein